MSNTNTVLASVAVLLLKFTGSFIVSTSWR